MNYKEEQDQELEVLQSIYPDELAVLNSHYPNISFEVSLLLELDQLDDLIIESLTKKHTLLVQITLPESYPDETPIVSISCHEEYVNGDDEVDDADEGEDEPEFDSHGNKIISKLENIPNSISFDSFIPILLNERINNDEYMEDEMMVMKGMQMCFTLLSSIKEQCENWFLNELKERELKHQREIELKEKKENAKFIGTKVTRESYLKWREDFRKKLKLDERDQLRRLKAHNGKLTGKQMFEQGLVGTEDEETGDIDGEDGDGDSNDGINTNMKDSVADASLSNNIKDLKI
ncbi:Gir2p PWA37_003512 [Arxiozyma heterogenica]|uniref:Gir2p n=1 Tax=Arxiozyma heterogenica TaxID=278026 RepID=UPI002F1D7BCA